MLKYWVPPYKIQLLGKQVPDICVPLVHNFLSTPFPRRCAVYYTAQHNTLHMLCLAEISSDHIDQDRCLTCTPYRIQTAARL